jgi:hypothetical protein
MIAAILSRYDLSRKRRKIGVAGVVLLWYDVLAAHAENMPF